jgi:fumarate reductase subunit D
MLGAAAVVVPVQALKEHMVHFLLCRMTVLPLWRTSIRASASLQDQRLQRGGKRVSETADIVMRILTGL